MNEIALKTPQETAAQDLKAWFTAMAHREAETVPDGFWQGQHGRQHGIQAVRWLIEEWLEIPVEEIPKQVTANTFKEHGFAGMLECCFDFSPFQAINAAYPDRFKPWEFHTVPMNFWKGKKGRKRAREAVRWLCDKLGWDEIDARKNLTKLVLRQHGLSGMIQRVYDNHMTKLMDDVFPQKYDLEALKESGDLADVLYELYYEKRLSGTMIAERFEVSMQTIYNQMDKYGMPRRSYREATLNAIELGRRDIEEERRKGIATIKKEVKKGKRKWNRPGPYGETIRRLEREEGKSFKKILRSLYWDQKLSQREIATYLRKRTKDYDKPYHVRGLCIGRRMKKYGIPVRGKSEATRLQWEKRKSYSCS